MRIRAYIAIAGGVLVVGGAAAVLVDMLSAHYDEPIIIDNGPTKMKLLPFFFHDGNLESRDSGGGRQWAVTDHDNHVKIKIKWTTKGQDKEEKGPLSSSAVVIYLHHGNGQEAGQLTVNWASKATTLNSTDAGGHELKWKKNKGGWFEYLGLHALDAADRRIKKVTYETSLGQQNWPPADTDIKDVSDVDVILCPGLSTNKQCEFEP